jgi:hypothetical protein
MAPSPHVLQFPALSLSLSNVTPFSRTTPLHVHVLDHLHVHVHFTNTNTLLHVHVHVTNTNTLLHVHVHVTNTNTLLHVSPRTTSSTKSGINPSTGHSTSHSGRVPISRLPLPATFLLNIIRRHAKRHFQHSSIDLLDRLIPPQGGGTIDVLISNRPVFGEVVI